MSTRGPQRVRGRVGVRAFTIALAAAAVLATPWGRAQSSKSVHQKPTHTTVAKPAKTGHSGTKATPDRKKVSPKTSVNGASKGKSGRKPAAKTTRGRGAGKAAKKVPSAQSIKLKNAFQASSQLRPMAQQLAATRSPQAYAGVQAYARSHPGEAAATAYLALAHAYSLDRRYPEAAANFHLAGTGGASLGDYSDYLGAQAVLQGGHPAEAYPLLENFSERHPDSIFLPNAPVLLATARIQQNDAAGALRVLRDASDTLQSSHNDFRYILARAYQLTGDSTQAAAIFRGLYVKQPLSFEASQSRQQLQAMGTPLSAAEIKAHADQLFNAKHYADAGEEYHALQHGDASLSQADQQALQIYAAVCDLKLKHISRREIERLPDTSDDSAALKMYMLAEISRNEGDTSGHDSVLSEMIRRFPSSRWLEEALYSGGNMYLLKHDSSQAIYHYSTLVQMFPRSSYAPSAHWRWAWMSYRMRHYEDAARLMEEQVQLYPAGIEVPSALFWRARIYEDEEKNLPQAISFYRSLTENYVNFYYAGLARQRLAILGGKTVAEASSTLEAVRKPALPELTGDLPEDDPHFIKAKLLANAGLNEYIGPEIQAGEDAAQWGALGQAEIFTSYGEYTRALQSMKRSGMSFFSIPMEQIPPVYWHLLFPQPYWSEIVANSQANGLDPYLVASLIRQESEFNAGAVSHANAYGLMQLLPSVGKALSKKQGMRGFNAAQLLNPTINLRLGTINLRQVLDRFGGQIEYALAAYNAGDVPVRQWMALGSYKDIPEFVESIPYTETREYVQAILRNREMYRSLYAKQ